MRGIWLALMPCLLASPTGPAAAQQRVVVVPGEPGVVIAARGRAQPHSVLAPAPSTAALARSRGAPGFAGSDAITDGPAPALLPLILAGVLAAVLGNGGSSGGGSPAAPVRTR